MFSVSWAEIRELLAEHLTEWLDFLKQFDLIGELRELAQLVAATEVDAMMLMFAVVALLVRLEGRTYRW